MKKVYVILSLLSVLFVSACGLTKKDLGMSRQGPDETKVQTNEPLVLPPEYSVRPQRTTEKADD